MDRKRRFGKTPVTLLATAIASVLTAPLAFAQSAPAAAEATQLDAVNVTGYRQSLQ